MITISENTVVFDTPDFLEVSGRVLSASEINQAIGGRKQISITADTLHLNAPLIAPGANVHIVARIVYGGDQAEVNVNGADGTSASSTAKPKPVDPNAPPPDGASGTDAASGGSIGFVAHNVIGRLTLRAAGGRGGSGQPGGEGADGAHGWPHDIDGEVGGNGGASGTPGKGGDSGNSGNGGAILAFVDQGRDNLSVEVTGGLEVAEAANGTPGQPGGAGRGGRIKHCEEDLTPDPGVTNNRGIYARPMTCYWTENRHPNGLGGVQTVIAAKARKGKAGEQGRVIDAFPAQHTVPLSYRGLRLLTIEAETLHIKGKLAEAVELAGWLFVLCTAAGPGRTDDIALRCAALIWRIAVGAPPAGIQGLYAPLTPFEVLLGRIENMLASRSRANGYADDLKQDYRNEVAIRKTVNATIAVGGRIITDAESKLKEIVKRRNTIVQTIDTISGAYWDVWLEVQQADKDFREEVSRKNPCGNFLNAVILVATVAVTVISAGSATAAVVAAGAEVLKAVKKDEKSQAAFDKVIEESGGVKSRLAGYAKDVGELIAQAERLKEFLGGDEMTPPQDLVRVGMSREDFDKMVQPYRGLASTERLRGLMDKFFSMTETRNNLLLEHDHLVVEAASIKAQAAAAKRQLDELVRTDGAALLANSIDAYESALWADLETGKVLMAALVSANLAYEHMTLTNRQIDLSSVRGDHLENQYIALRGENFRPTIQAAKTESMIVITDKSHPEVFKALKTGEAVVSLMPEHVAGPQKRRWDERAHSVGIQIAGISAKKGTRIELSATMINCGVSWFKRQGGVLFSIPVPSRGAAVTASTALDLDVVRNSNNLNDAIETTVDVSPFGLWRLRIDGIQQHLKSITSLTFFFIGTSRIAPEVAGLIDVERAALTEMLNRPQTSLLGTGASTSIDTDEAFVSTSHDPLLVRPQSPREQSALIRSAEDITYVEHRMRPAPVLR
ncbi:hypothetical protein J2X76_003947 [Neorhizobium sp. 2083]|uniref:hypothetical protein n=1 Tax=Neorhizobium sp. 2083 TaxID=2817762 RepID=UPI0028664F45|nr:hypothetical protein [Neorhizobium sp. 2083]MDR6818765.1 hypothetical protein [Neorhizobium sp. 2083]